MENNKKRKRVELSLKSKIELIREFEKTGKSHRKLAEDFDIGKTQVHVIEKNLWDD